MNYISLKNGFRVYIQLERGLSVNTLNAYLHDIELFFSFLNAEKESKSIRLVSLNDLREFVKFIHQLGLGAQFQARVISDTGKNSGIKSF